MKSLKEEELMNVYGGETENESEVIKYWSNEEDGIHTGWEHR